MAQQLVDVPKVEAVVRQANSKCAAS
jgi:hypothetical protein